MKSQNSSDAVRVQLETEASEEIGDNHVPLKGR